ncbi:protein of unknown function [Pseudomonas sp. JV551A1]|nr:protein of unknown function [Pseudomonas sp. JV551A1]
MGVRAASMIKASARVCSVILRLLRQHGAAHFVRFAMEHRHQLAALVLDADVVQAGAALAADLAGAGGEHVIAQRRGQVVDAATQSDGGLVVTVAGESKRRIGQGEQKAAMAGAMPLDHVGAYRHAQAGLARAGFQQADAKALGGLVAGVHGLGTGLCQFDFSHAGCLL